MTTYILLRKNKESGPFSLQELKSHGVLHTDLFWVEGQSVCWLNPGEIKELKELAGAEPVNKQEDLSKYQPPSNLDVHEPQTPISPLAEEKAGPAETRQVYNNLTAENNSAAYTETKYSKPLDEIKELYLKNLERQQRKGRLKLNIPPLVKKAAPYGVFLVLGLIAGAMINRKGRPGKAIAEQITREKPQVLKQENSKAETAAPLVPSAQDETTATPAEKPVQETVISDKPPVEPAPSAKKVKKPETAKDEKVPAVQAETIEKTEQKKEPEKETIPLADISSQVSAKTNDYQVGSFGGIRNLQILLRNDSEQTLEKVTVELRYLKPADELLRTENIYFYSIPPRSSHTQAVPKSNRGVKVTCRVVHIEIK